MIRRLVAKGGKVDDIDPEFGATALLFAVADHDLKVVRTLLNLGANPNIPERTGWSPLQTAASGDPRDSEIVAALLAAGANVGYRTKDRPTAHVLALRRRNVQSARLIQQASARAAAKNGRPTG